MKMDHEQRYQTGSPNATWPTPHARRKTGAMLSIIQLVNLVKFSNKMINSHGRQQPSAWRLAAQNSRALHDEESVVKTNDDERVRCSSSSPDLETIDESTFQIITELQTHPWRRFKLGLGLLLR